MSSFYPWLQSWVMSTLLAVWTDFYEGRTQAAEPVVWRREAGMSVLNELCYVVTDGFNSSVSSVSAGPLWCLCAIGSGRCQPRSGVGISVFPGSGCCWICGSAVLLSLQAYVFCICDFRKSPLLESCSWGCFVTFPGCGLLVCLNFLICCSSCKPWDLKEM